MAKASSSFARSLERLLRVYGPEGLSRSDTARLKDCAEKTLERMEDVLMLLHYERSKVYGEVGHGREESVDKQKVGV